MAFDKDETPAELFFKIKKLNVKLTGLSRKVVILSCAKHNLRELYAEIGYAEGGKIDGRRSHLNVVLSGALTAAGVNDAANVLMTQAGIVVDKLKTTTVFGVEIVISLSKLSSVDRIAYFSASVAWVSNHFKCPVLSAIIHNDQSAPHVHIIFLPIVDGRMCGSDMLKKDKFQAATDAFFKEVAAKFGVSRPKPAKTLTAETKLKFSELIGNTLDCPALDDNPKRLPALIRMISSPSESAFCALVESFGFTLPAGRRTFAEIMTAPYKPQKSTPIGLENQRSPIGLRTACIEPIEKNLTLSCVGLADLKGGIQSPAFSLPPIVLLADSPPALDSKESEKTHTARIEDAGALESKTKARAFDSALDSGVKEKIGDSAGGEADNDGFDCEAVPPVPDTPLRKSGRKPVEIDMVVARRMKKSGAHINEIAEYFHCKKSTLYKLMPHPTKTLAAENQPGLWH